MHKPQLLVLSPGPQYQPNARLNIDRYKLLSKSFEGHILSCVVDEDFMSIPIGSFLFKAMLVNRRGLSIKFKLFLFMIKTGLKLHKTNKINAIICYDPVFTGTTGLVLKWLTGAKLIIEVNNSNLSKAFEMEKGKGLTTKIKIFISTTIRNITLHFSDGIKFLTENQSKELKETFPKNKKTFTFHDFVPTNFFLENTPRYEDFILFAGYPFHRKGIDILIKAFDEITKKHPNFKLKLVGHLLEEEAKEKCPDSINDNVLFIKPMFYDDLTKEFMNCYCFVLPSREEGMGRVLIEAMAASKPLIGSNVGGIPNVINDSINGFLFNSEDVTDLALKLDKLLSNPELARNLGETGKKYVHDEYSQEKYFYYYTEMINSVLNKEMIR